MSLNVDWSKVSPPLTDEEKDTSAFNAGMSLVVLGFQRVGDKAGDLQEILARARFYEKLHGPMIRYADPTKPSPVGTLEYWQRWIGLGVNSAKESRAVWSKRMVTSAWQDIDWKLRQEF